MKFLMTFGGLGWSYDDQQFRIHQSRAMTALFANLILNHDVVRTRDAIAESIWPEIEKDKSRSNLNTALWRLRKDLKSRDLAEFISLEVYLRGLKRSHRLAPQPKCRLQSSNCRSSIFCNSRYLLEDL